MPSYPQILKYAVNDHVYCLGKTYTILPIKNRFGVAGHLNDRTRGLMQKLYVTGWRTDVYEINSTIHQDNYYTAKKVIGYDPSTPGGPGTFIELYATTEIELHESKLFSSQNHLISAIKRKYFNSTYNGDSTGSMIFRNWGLLEGEPPTFSDMEDYAGMDFSYANLGLIEDESYVTMNLSIIGGTVGSANPFVNGYPGITKPHGAIMDNCNFTGATMPFGFTTRADFRFNAYSYDELSTIWTNGLPIGRTG